jgi:hypothetical protein
MNKRIQELAEQANGSFGTGQEFAVVFGELEDFNKFAELIVRECAEVGLDSVEDGDDLDAIMKRVHNNILKHFGVEE